MGMNHHAHSKNTLTRQSGHYPGKNSEEILNNIKSAVTALLTAKTR